MRALVLVLLMTASTAARADEAAAPKQTRVVRYAKSIVPFDLVAVGFGVAAFVSYDRTSSRVTTVAVAASAMTFLIGSAAIHDRYDNDSGQGMSLVTRAVLPLLGMVFGFWQGPQDDFGSPSGALAGLVIGAAVAVGLDYVAFAQQTVAITPTAAPGGVGLALVGAF